MLVTRKAWNLRITDPLSEKAPYERPVTQKSFPYHDVTMLISLCLPKETVAVFRTFISDRPQPWNASPEITSCVSWRSRQWEEISLCARSLAIGSVWPYRLCNCSTQKTNHRQYGERHWVYERHSTNPLYGHADQFLKNEMKISHRMTNRFSKKKLCKLIYQFLTIEIVSNIISWRYKIQASTFKCVLVGMRFQCEGFLLCIRANQLVSQTPHFSCTKD